MPRRRRWAAVAVALLCLGAGVAALAAVRAGWLGAHVLDEAPREPFVRLVLPPVRAGILDVGRSCPGQEPADPPSPDAWRAWLEGLSWSSTVLATPSDHSLGGLSLLVAPRAACLSAAEADALRGYVRDGGGLLATGPLGLRDERGREVGWTLLQELLGADHFEVLPDGGPAFVAFRDGSPLGAGLEALTIEPPRRARFIAVTGGPHPYWSDERLQPLDPSLPQSYQSAAVAVSFGAGRVAWLGFVPHPSSRAPAGAPGGRLLLNAGAWAAGIPIVSLAPWPPPHRSAVLLRVNVAGRPRNASFVARVLLDARAGGTFVVRDDSLDDLSGLGTAMSRAGDVALAVDAGTDPSRRLASRIVLEARRLRVRRVLGVWPNGALAGDLDDVEAARASAEAGLGYYLVEGTSGRGQPTVRRITQRLGPWHRQRDVVGFGRLSADDLGLSPLGFAGLEPAWVRRRLLADFEVTAALGGLYVLSFHTQALGAPERLETLSWLIDEWRGRGAWIVAPSRLAAWARARAGLGLSAVAAQGRLRLSLRAPAGPTGWPVSVDVHPPPGTTVVVEPGSDDCRLDPRLPGPATHVLLSIAPQARDYRCDLAFVPSS